MVRLSPAMVRRQRGAHIWRGKRTKIRMTVFSHSGHGSSTVIECSDPRERLPIRFPSVRFGIGGQFSSSAQLVRRLLTHGQLVWRSECTSWSASSLFLTPRSSRALPVGTMIRRDAKAMVAYSGLAELKAALDPRQRFVDEITPVGRSMAEVSRGEPLLSSAGRAAPLTGGFTAGPRAPAKSCARVAAIGKIARAFRVMDRVVHRQARGRQWHQPSLWQVLDLFQLGCISKMRGDQSIGSRDRRGWVPH